MPKPTNVNRIPECSDFARRVIRSGYWNIRPVRYICLEIGARWSCLIARQKLATPSCGVCGIGASATNMTVAVRIAVGYVTDGICDLCLRTNNATDRRSSHHPESVPRLLLPCSRPSLVCYINRQLRDPQTNLLAIFNEKVHIQAIVRFISGRPLLIWVHVLQWKKLLDSDFG